MLSPARESCHDRLRSAEAYGHIPYLPRIAPDELQMQQTRAAPFQRLLEVVERFDSPPFYSSQNIAGAQGRIFRRAVRDDFKNQESQALRPRHSDDYRTQNHAQRRLLKIACHEPRHRVGRHRKPQPSRDHRIDAHHVPARISQWTARVSWRELHVRLDPFGWTQP